MEPMKPEKHGTSKQNTLCLTKIRTSNENIKESEKPKKGEKRN
jgi:hypothetical protein